MQILKFAEISCIIRYIDRIADRISILRRDYMKCRRCKTELRSDDEFCYHCGERTTLLQRMVASRMFAGSIVAIVLVAMAAVATWLILTDRINLPF